MQTPPASAPAIPAWLGYGGLIPFVALACVSVVSDAHAPICRHALLAYGAVILAFVGALHWGFAMTPAVRDARRSRAYAWSVLPALLAWVALLVASMVGSALLVVGFVLQYWQDLRLTQSATLPAWYLPKR
jgi:hypothetical protein